MPIASRSQKRLKFAPFPVCHRTFPLETTVNNYSVEKKRTTPFLFPPWGEVGKGVRDSKLPLLYCVIALKYLK
jgi:hypothetical protein